jgi:lipopolysaccharide transport system ATP-binding protein
MSNYSIEVKNISKNYRIGMKEQIEDTLSGVISSWIQSPINNYKKLRNLSRVNDHQNIDILRALDNVSFKVKHGEVLGIIGRNGAGKSTLLKILSRITQPTSGTAVLNGRVASLLEVGTGFHPELSGRENIFLNGTILGMKRHEIVSNFSEIVEFSGIEKFIDTPVKRYSSGMRVRLAFSVAAHLKPEILLIDEVLAVGDLNFQKKCLGKMESISKTGRTVIFISHNMAAIQSLCSRGLLLIDGKVAADTSANEAVNRYIEYNVETIKNVQIGQRFDRKAGEVFRFQKVEYFDSKSKKQIDIAFSGQTIEIKIFFVNHSDSTLKDINIGMAFSNNQGVFLFACGSRPQGSKIDIEPGEGYVVCTINKLPLTAGRIYHSLHCDYNNQVLDNVQEAGFINVEKGDYYGTGLLPGGSKQGLLVDYSYKNK